MHQKFRILISHVGHMVMMISIIIIRVHFKLNCHVALMTSELFMLWLLCSCLSFCLSSCFIFGYVGQRYGGSWVCAYVLSNWFTAHVSSRLFFVNSCACVLSLFFFSLFLTHTHPSFWYHCSTWLVVTIGRYQYIG